MTQASIAHKLAGYRLFQAGIELTVTMSASPFLYSGVIMAYCPLTTGASTFGLADVVIPTGFSTYPPLQMSTFPYHFFMYPQTDSTYTMSVPWICPTEFATVVGDRPAMGVFKMYSMMPLRAAGAASTNTCTISVLARLVDPKLVGPTATVYQSNTVMGISKDLARVGFGAASAIASSTGKVMKLVGLTNEANLTPASAITTCIFPGLSSGEASVPVDNLGLGLSGSADESDISVLDLAALAARPSYLGEFSWTLSAPVDQTLATLGVTPSHFSSVTRTGNLSSTTFYDLTPSLCGYVASMFRQWSGTVCFKFKVMCSQYHRGKIRFWYDNYNLTSKPDEGYLKSEILDLATDSEVIIKIPMASQAPWLFTDPTLSGANNGPPPALKNFSTGSIDFDIRRMNGCVMAKVCQKLSTLESLGNVLVGCWVWLEDAKFAEPYYPQPSGAGPVTLVSAINWQSGEVVCKPNLTVTVAPEDKPIPSTNIFESFPIRYESGNVDIGDEPVVVNLGACKTSTKEGYFEEQVTNLKELAHRAQFYKCLTVPLTLSSAATPGSRGFVTWVIPRVPRFFGPEYSSVLTGSCEKMSNGVAFNMVMTPYLQRIGAMFQGYKGSIRWRFAVSPASGSGALRMLSVSKSHYEPGIYLRTDANGSSSQAAQTAFIGSNDMGAGKAICTGNYPALTVDVPDYYPVKMIPFTNAGIQSNTAKLLAGRYDESVLQPALCDSIAVSVSVYNVTGTYLNGDKNIGDTVVDAYVSAAPNFRFVQFKGVPFLSYCPNKTLPVMSTTY